MKQLYNQSISQTVHQTVHNHTTNLANKQTGRPSLPSFLPIRVLYVWAMVCMGMVIYVFVWFSMGLTAMTFIDAIVASASFADPWDQVVEFIRNCFLIHPIISLIGWFIYGVVNSHRRDVETWK